MWQRIIWNEEPGGNVEHIEEHGLTVDDVEHVLASYEEADVSRSSGLPCVFGYTPDGTYIIVVYELLDADTIYPITAYAVPEPRPQRQGLARAGEDHPMTQKKFERIVRPATAEERQRHAAIRRKMQQEFPPTPDAHRQEAPPGLPAQIQRAREAQGLTWYAVAKRAGIPNPNTVRDIEYGRDAKLSNVQSVAKVLGLRLELVQEPR